MTHDPSLGTRYGLLPLVVVALLFIAAAPVTWLLHEIHQDADVVSIDYENAGLYQKTFPFMRYASARMVQGDLPLWNPRLYAGVPFAADFANGVFHPLNAVFLGLPTARALAAVAFLSLTLTGIFYVLFARALGLSYPASVLGGVVFTFSGASLAASSRPAFGGVLVWAVMACWALREFKNTGRYAPTILAGIALGLMVLSGGWALAAIFAVYVALYAVVLTFRGAGDPPHPRLKGALVVLGVALGLSAIQWGLSLPWLIERAAPWETFWRCDIAAQTPANPGALIRQLLASEPGPLPRVVYVGIAALLLAPAGLFFQGLKRDVWFFAFSVPACFALVLTPPGSPFGTVAPLFAYPAVFGLSTLAAMGAHRLLAGRRGNPVWYVGLLTIAAAAGLFVLIEPLGRSTIIVALALILPGLLLRNRWVGRMGTVAVAGLLFFDLTVANTNRFAHPLQDAPQCSAAYGDLMATAEERAMGARVLVASHALTKALPENIAMIYAIYSANGSHVPLTQPEEVWWNAVYGAAEPGAEAATPSRRLLDVMAVRALILGQGAAISQETFDDPEGALQEIARHDAARLILNHRALPRTLIVPNATPVDGVSGALEVIQSTSFDPMQTATVDLQAGGIESLVRSQGPVPGAAPPIVVTPNTGTISDPGPNADPRPVTEPLATIRSATATRLVLDVASPQAGVTVLNDRYASGWRASIDGVAVPILRVNGLFRGVATPPGRHTIVFSYQPVGFYAGAAVSLLTLALLVIAGLRTLWRVA